MKESDVVFELQKLLDDCKDFGMYADASTNGSIFALYHLLRDYGEKKYEIHNWKVVEVDGE